MDKVQRKNEQRTQEEYNNKNKKEVEVFKKRKQREVEKLSNILLDDPSTVLIFGTDGISIT